MKGHVSIEIPTKKYIRAFILHELGPQPVLNQKNHIGAKLYDLLDHETNPWPDRLSYDHTVKVFIPITTFYRRGANLNANNVNKFNNYLEHFIKDRYRFLMDFYISIFHNFTENLELVRQEIGISNEDWDYESIKKDYYRYRKKNGKPMLYDRA